MRESNYYSDYVNELYLYFKSYQKGRKRVSSLFIFLPFWWMIIVPIIFFLTIGYLAALCVMPRVKANVKMVKGGKLCVARTFATVNKLNFLKVESVKFYNEMPFSYETPVNLYNLQIKQRVKAFINGVIIFFIDVFKLGLEIAKYLNFKDTLRAIQLYTFRIPHKVGFSAYIEQLIDYEKPNIVVTGNKEDRFALSEQTVCRRKAIELICYPHGLEYGMRLPRGVVGDKFFCYSQETKSYYENIYSCTGQEFHYAPDIVAKMLGNATRSEDVITAPPRIVFFPESRGKDINLKIISELLRAKLEIYLKLHPLDSEDAYLALGLKEDNLILDFDDAITGNVVLARKSTVLLEAVYCSSSSCALLFDSGDEQVFNEQFPSLWDERIMRVRNIEQLCDWLKTEASRPMNEKNNTKRGF